MSAGDLLIVLRLKRAWKAGLLKKPRIGAGFWLKAGRAPKVALLN